MRPMWSGSLTFGLVNIPVRMYKASSEDRLEFHFLHKKDHAPVRYVRVCQADGEEVAYEDLERGYEYKRGEYVVVSDADFEKANVRKTKTIDIVSFADAGDIDPVYFERPYYLEPEAGAGKAYALMREALRRSNKVGIARFVFTNRERLGVVKLMDEVIVLGQIRYPSELRDVKGLELPSAEQAGEKELEMALALVGQFVERFDPSAFHDTYREDLERLIAAKVAGKKTVALGEAPEPTRAKDLMTTLRASLEERQQATVH